MCEDGAPIENILTEDCYHLSERGLTILAGNFKNNIRKALNLSQPDRSRSRGLGRGVGRGRGFGGGRGAANN